MIKKRKELHLIILSVEFKWLAEYDNSPLATRMPITVPTIIKTTTIAFS